MEQQLTELKQELKLVNSKLDKIVVLEVNHNHTVESVARCHKRVDTLEAKIEDIAKEAANNTFLTKIMERMGWIVMSAGVGIAAYFIR